MKKILFLSIVLSLFATAAVAQDAKLVNDPGPPPLILPDNPPGPTNYYPNTTGTITRSGYTYKYRNGKIGLLDLPHDLSLYNASSSYLDVVWGHKDGTQLTIEEAIGLPESYYISNTSQTKEQTLAMIKSQFTAQQKNAIKGGRIFIEARVDPSTGRVADVYFTFYRNGPFANIPVETYRSIELALKQNFIVTSTAQGRKMNYHQFSWNPEF